MSNAQNINDMTTSRIYAGKYEIKINNLRYFAEAVNYGYGTEWNLSSVTTSADFGDSEEWCNTYPTLKALKAAVKNS